MKSNLAAIVLASMGLGAILLLVTWEAVARVRAAWRRRTMTNAELRREARQCAAWSFAGLAVFLVARWLVES